MKSAMRLSQLKKLCRPGSKTWESLPAVKKLRFENLAADSHQRLDRALVAFDRARSEKANLSLAKTRAVHGEEA